MTEKIKTFNSSEFNKLSIQVSLNGLSFCVLDTVDHKIELSDAISFEKERTPYGLQKGLVALLERNSLSKKTFSEVLVIHRNSLFSLVPKSLFNEENLANYLKFNSKILATDHISFDELDDLDIVNVYISYMNVNNYIYELFGEFTYKHNGSVLLETLLKSNTTENKPICYVNSLHSQMDIVVISQKKLLFYNSFKYHTKEDFIYYLLFTYEQLKLKTEKTALKLFGSIQKDDELYALCYQYIKNVSIYNSNLPFNDGSDALDFEVLNSL